MSTRPRWWRRRCWLTRLASFRASGPHGLAHLTQLGRRCREHVHVLEPAGRDEPGPATPWDLSRSRARTSSASMRRYCSSRRARSSRNLRSSAGSPSAPQRAPRPSRQREGSRGRGHAAHGGGSTARHLFVVSIPANRSTASTASSRRASMSASRSARSSSALRSVSAMPTPGARAGDRGVANTIHLCGSRVTHHGGVGSTRRTATRRPRGPRAA